MILAKGQLMSEHPENRDRAHTPRPRLTTSDAVLAAGPSVLDEAVVFANPDHASPGASTH